MSILQGTLTVVVATVIASGMIVLTGNGIAEDKGETDAGNTVSSGQSDGVSKKLTVIDKKADEAVSKASISGINNIPLTPPPGPFLNEGAVISAQKSLLAPVAPKAPVGLSKQPEKRANSLHLKTAPVLSQKVVEPKVNLKKPFAPTRPSITPKLSQSAPQIDQKMELASPSGQSPKQAMPKTIATPAPVAPKNMIEQPKMKSTDRPIWVQGGNFTKSGSSSKSATQQGQAVMGMPNMGWNNNYPAQQYIYVPVPMMPSNMSPPQMPKFNGNIIPPSNYWGAPMPPSNAPNITIQKESKESKSAPVKKGNK